LGAFVYFSPYSLRGFHNLYIIARLEAVVRKYLPPRDAERCQFVLDVSSNGAVSLAHRLVSLDEAIALGVLDRGSSLHRAMLKYDLATVLLAGTEVSGPNLAMIRALERLFRHRLPGPCLDLFSGTGALAQVAVSLGCPRVDAVDLQQREQTLGAPSRIRAVEADVWTFRPESRYDLVIMDPYFDMSVRAAEELLPKLRDSCERFLLDAGPSFETQWLRRVREAVLRVAKSATFSRCADNTVAFGEF
jgi:predicted RNA methylase